MTTPASIPGVNSGFPIPRVASANELFALTDEQILDIEPVIDSAVIPNEVRNLSSSSTAANTQQSKRDSSVASLPRNDGARDGSGDGTPSSDNAARGTRATNHDSANTSHQSPLTSHNAEPPRWLAEMMDDPQSGGKARDLWNGMQQARQESAAYREVFAKPEDARALKELYPGGVEQARAAAERARTLEEIDSAFYGGAGKSPKQLSAGRTALAQRMLREDPAAFREMVFAGLRALEEAGRHPSRISASNALSTTNVSGSAGNVVPPFKAASSEREEAGLKPGTTQTEANQEAEHNPQLDAYRAFEKSTNEELERSVGGAISRALEQALPNVGKPGETASVGARYIVPVQQRLGAVIREEVETALKGDRQLGEQIAQVLATRRFDDTARAQVVRLINDRAQQLVPGAAKRVLQDWTQTAFASHRGKLQRGSEVPQPTDVRTDAGQRVVQNDRTTGTSAKAAAADRAEKAAGLSPRPVERSSGRAATVDYRKLSDEQILEL